MAGNSRTDHTGARDAASSKIVTREQYIADHPPKAPSHTGPTASGARTQSGVFVPAHMLRPGATVEEAAAMASGLGVTTLPPHASHASAVDQREGEELTGHEYDGIQEYDNPTPGWWYLIWNATIVFSVLYVLVYHSLVPTLAERHASAESHALEVRFADLRKLPEGEAKLLAIMGEKPWLDQGAAIFQSSCTLCHGQQGEGLIGPNLTDDYFLNATDLNGMYDVVLNGSANGAMPPRGGAPLKAEEVALVTAYVASLRGQNLPGPRVAEGIEIPPFPPIPTDAPAPAPE